MLSLFAVVVLGALPHYVAAQSLTNAECEAGVDNWSFNSLNQSPCDVAAALAGVCVGTTFTLQPLSPGFVYLGPQPATATPCRCSSVYYSLLSACAACQNANFITWSLYKTNCTVIYDQVFPDPIPSNVAVPHYAYLNVTVNDTFSITLAENAGGAESTAIPTATSSNSFSLSTPGAANTSPAFSNSSSKKSNAGAIAGGVVGGLVALALIAGLVFWLLRRNRAPSAPSSAYDPVLTQTPMTQTPTGISTNPMSVASSYPATPAPRPYDPNDPSTFPTNINESPGFNPYAPSPQLYPAQMTPTYTGTSAQPSFSRPQYNGAPEVQ